MSEKTLNVIFRIEDTFSKSLAECKQAPISKCFTDIMRIDEEYAQVFADLKDMQREVVEHIAAAFGIDPCYWGE